MRTKSIISWIVSLGLVRTGVALMAVFAPNFFGVAPEGAATNSSDPRGFNVPDLGGATQAGVGAPRTRPSRLPYPV